MHNIIHRVQTRMGGWVGSSVVHLGDSNVPNALVFIDKVCCSLITAAATTAAAVRSDRG